jgi:DNA-binding MarR family transcriptional regulator
MKAKMEAIGRTIARECVAVRVRLVGRVITGIYDEALRPLGLTINQLNLLVAVSQLRKANPKVLGKLMQMDASTLSRNLERMREQGWLETSKGKDARTLELRLTAAGSHLVEKAEPRWRKAQTRAKALLGEENLAQLVRIADNVWSKISP